jgi:hypothetical protein
LHYEEVFHEHLGNRSNLKLHPWTQIQWQRRPFQQLQALAQDSEQHKQRKHQLILCCPKEGYGEGAIAFLFFKPTL